MKKLRKSGKKKPGKKKPKLQLPEMEAFHPPFAYKLVRDYARPGHTPCPTESPWQPSEPASKLAIPEIWPDGDAPEYDLADEMEMAGYILCMPIVSEIGHDNDLEFVAVSVWRLIRRVPGRNPPVYVIDVSIGGYSCEFQVDSLPDLLWALPQFMSVVSAYSKILLRGNLSSVLTDAEYVLDYPSTKINSVGTCLGRILHNFQDYC